MEGHILSEVGKAWRGWQEGEYQIHFICTGVAEAILHIFPDGTTMLLDCGDHPAITRLNLAVPVVPNPGRLAGDWIARYIKRVLPEGYQTKNDLPLIDYMVLSHFHSDHCGIQEWCTNNHERRGLHGCYRSGFGLAAEQLAFKKAIDRGWPFYDDPRPGAIPVEELDHMTRLYKALHRRDGLEVEKFRLGAKDQIVPLHAPESVNDFEITNITANGKILCKDGSIKNLYEEKLKTPGGLNENGMSLGMIIRYGKFSFYTDGDFSDKVPTADGQVLEIEDALAEELPKVDAAKINHHGHNSMPAKIVTALSARIWLACVWDQLHTLDHVMDRLSDRNLYPGPRMHFPTVFPKERCESAADKAYVQDIAPEVKGMGAHVVITVPKGGETYRVTCLKAVDESMEILGEYMFESRG
jgi:hypothetical protein